MIELMDGKFRVKVYRLEDGSLLGWCRPVYLDRPGSPGERRLARLAPRSTPPLRLTDLKPDRPVKIEPIPLAVPYRDGYGVPEDFPLDGLEDFVRA